MVPVVGSGQKPRIIATSVGMKNILGNLLIEGGRNHNGAHRGTYHEWILGRRVRLPATAHSTVMHLLGAGLLDLAP
eukprot:9109156-Karenia_brevis.AAC.1